MGRSLVFGGVWNNLKLALRLEHCEKAARPDTSEVLAQMAEAQAARYKRRQFLRGLSTAALSGGAISLLTRCGTQSERATTERAAIKPTDAQASTAIIGAGLAGLTAAYELQKRGLQATVYEAASRAGGRQFSLRSFFPGQVAERGGELIDNLHKTVIGYAREFGLTLEDVGKSPGEEVYYFNSQHYGNAEVVDEFRDFVSTMRTDLRALSSAVTADNFTPRDAELDQTSLLEYLEGRNSTGATAGHVAKAALLAAYSAEYGLAAEEQSALNFLSFIHADRRSKFTPFGVFSDERYHVVEGNDAIASGLAQRLSKPIQLGHRLIRAKKKANGRIELTFQTENSTTISRTFDFVIFATPFSVLREVELDRSLELPAWKRIAIDELGYGTNAKMMVGFSRRVWRDLLSNGASYSDLANHQATWETNPTAGGLTQGILTDYSSAARGANLRTSDVQGEAQKFLDDLEFVYPGSRAAARRSGGHYLAHLEHWPSNPNALGSYTCYRPGQFTRIGGNEGKTVGNLFFAGEHTDSFYSWQGFMEGAMLSGIRVAEELQTLLRKRA